MADSSDPRAALEDMVSALKSVFKQYSMAARKRAYKSLDKEPAKHHMNQLLDSPTRQMPGVQKWLHFKEWLENQDDFPKS